VLGRRDDDLVLVVPVTFAEAALGTQVKVPTLDGPVTVKVAPGTSSGQTLRVRGRGVKRKNGTAGDLLVTVNVAVPQRLSSDAREALERYAAATAGDDPRAHLQEVTL
jgi:molecular chaperone DnaJ